VNNVETVLLQLGSCRSATELPLNYARDVGSAPSRPRTKRRGRSWALSARPVDAVSLRLLFSAGQERRFYSRGFVESKLRHAAESKLRHVHKQNAAGFTERSPAPPSRTTNSTASRTGLCTSFTAIPAA
jgi:hypothetical protein